MALDHLYTVRPIWRGHLSSPESKEILKDDAGMLALHNFLKTLDPKVPEPQNEPQRPVPSSSSSGDKPDPPAGVAAQAGEPCRASKKHLSLPAQKSHSNFVIRAL